jgi:tetratricopeptide (TPR) repeat protein
VEHSQIGRYQIQRRLGRGGMGSLYLARDPDLDRLVAIKVLKDDLLDDEEIRARFGREARSVARLRHPNIIVVFDVGEDQGRPFMAMEYVAGETLTEVLRRLPPLPLVRRLSLVEDLCSGLAHAHAAGIVHRDIKPANIMLDGDGILKILDFGIARLGNSGMTQDGIVMGSVNYMSPEQVIGRGVDHRSDIFATGAVLYEAVALEQAFPGGVDSGVLHRILHAGPVPLSERVPGVDAELTAIVTRALEREPAARYQDAHVMGQDLARVRRRLLDEGSDPLPSAYGSTVIARPRSPGSDAGRRPDSDRKRRMDPERLIELRRQQVEEHLRVGHEAFAIGDHEAALHAAERAVTIDPESPLAFDLIDRAKSAIEARTVRQQLADADRMLSEGRFDEAAALADRASAAIPDLLDVAELRDEVRRVSAGVAAAREREHRIAASLQRARDSLERGANEAALRAVYEVLSLDPARAEARELEQLAKERLREGRDRAEPLEKTLVARPADRSRPEPPLESRPTRFPVRVPYLLATAGVLAAAIAASMLARNPPDDAAPQASKSAPPVTAAVREPGPQVAAPQVTPAPAERPAPPPAAAPKPVPAASRKDPVEDRQTADAIDGYRQQARRLLGSGRLPEALAAVQSALRLDADDRGALTILESMATEARRSMQRAKEDAIAKRAPSAAAQAYQASLELEAGAQRDRLAGRIDQALPLWWRARDGFSSAAKEAETAARAAERAPAVVPPQPAGRPAAIQPAPRALEPKSEPPAQRPQFGSVSPADEGQAILQKLREYATAWTNLDVDAIRRVQELTGSELSAVRRSVEGAREYGLSIKVNEIKLESDGRHATVMADVRRRAVPRRGGEPTDVVERSIFSMEKRVGGWVIVSLR